MTDPILSTKLIEYFLSAFDLNFYHLSELQHIPRFKDILFPVDKSEYYSWDFFEDGEMIGIVFGNMSKDNLIERVFYGYLVNGYILTYAEKFNFSEKFVFVAKKIMMILNQLPDNYNLISKEFIDCLLCLNGIYQDKK